MEDIHGEQHLKCRKHNTVFTSQHDSLPSLVIETNSVTGRFFFQLQHHSVTPKTCQQ